MKPITLTQEAKDKAFEIFKNLLETATGDGDLKINITTETLMQAQGIEKPIVFMSSIAYVKMISLINNSSEELAWYGIATRVKNNYFIEDILVYPQIVTTTTVDADEEKCAKWFMELPDDVINNIKFQGHSHVNMAASPSGRDTNNWLKFAQLLKDDAFMLLCIGNKRGEFYWNIYDKAINVHFENKDIEMVIVDDKGNSIYDWAKKSIDDYIEKQKPVVTSQTGFLSSNNKSSIELCGRTYEVYESKQHSETKSKSTTNKNHSVYKEMMSHVPLDMRDAIDYETESDLYYTYQPGIPHFIYSNIYDCYTCQGTRFRTLYPKVKNKVGRPKKEIKDK